jgi:hypothetical protein
MHIQGQKPVHITYLPGGGCERLSREAPENMRKTHLSGASRRKSTYIHIKDKDFSLPWTRLALELSQYLLSTRSRRVDHKDSQVHGKWRSPAR